jgi:hypothetical protein
MTQIQLSDAQAVILSAACARDDALVFPVTARLKGGAVGNVCKSLLKHGLIEEVAATDHNTVWRHDEDRGPITLRATPRAFQALGISVGPEAGTETAVPEPGPEGGRRRNGTKQEAVIAMLRTPEGATIEEIIAATRWAGHTTRGFLSGALKKKLGLDVTSERVEGRGRCYRILV